MEKDLEFTRRALDLAKRGSGLVSPNPLVGCLIVSEVGAIVGEGFYTYDGIVHAEQIALDAAAGRARGATAYISLEPHAHRGKTPPCTKALIEAGIRRVVCPIEDPNPLVSGRGFSELTAAGIEVSTGILAKEAAELNEKFICWHRKGRPFVHLKLAMSLDGRISLYSTVSTALSGEGARSQVQNLRHEYDAILIGGNTALVDDPQLTDRSGRPRRRPLVRVVLDNRLQIPLASSLVATARHTPTLVFTNGNDGRKIDHLRDAGVEVIFSDAGGRNLNWVLAELKERQIQSLLVEGGSEIAGSFFDAALVDKVTFLVAPLIIGGRSAPAAISGMGTESLEYAWQLTNIRLDKLGNDIQITGYPYREK
ncbi:MAG: bifunctional diaminohydroxyphosphoribosylaminopyrimidine deaminase/5-amino-6-(5-phosphoribosylamino)uracil reductase RibD [Acidobacteria bacterium]|nr:bifunctional diaminohydroxyphosphoribosylaminopyrimidine deaminase/5-amino-6-(5-phosphoribosylamino)uracil reductase RibD [Acidobacteriota bacterium]